VTVAAVILSATPAGAVAPADGTPRVRRMADVAWAGGAVPVVVVAPDPDGDVDAALAGSEARLVAPEVADAERAGGMVHGFRAALAAVSDTDAALLWPARLCWVDAETLTSLIEAHGVDRGAILRPTWHDEAGWPVLVPTAILADLDAVPPDRAPADAVEALAAAGHRVVALDLGDPGCVLDADIPRADLPAYVGPPEPASGHHHEWGAATADAAADGLTPGA
jgi:CTP:molybdopterin cytidylyltransferase MocA